MLLCVVFGYVGVSFAGREISREEGSSCLAPSSTSVAVVVAGRLEQLNLNMQTLVCLFVVEAVKCLVVVVDSCSSATTTSLDVIGEFLFRCY